MTTQIVFDFGAVLFRWRPDLLVAEHLAPHAATPPAAQALARDIFHHDDWQSFDRGAVELPWVIERTARRLDLPQDELAGLMSDIPQRLVPIDETVALLTRLQARRERRDGIGLYFLSNMPAPFARVLEQRHGFLRGFDGGVFSGDVGLIKPDPAIYALAEARLGLVPQRTVFIDDLADNVRAARARGWRAIQFESAQQLAATLEI